jgi:Lon protease-like protein
MAQMTKIGLFPLNIVMFPNASVPLHIFEPRYRELVKVSVEEKKPFGINLVDSQRLYQTGCTVEVSDITQRYPDGRMDIIITGKMRYTLHSLREGEALYYTGIVDFFDDDDTQEVDATLKQQCISLYNEIVETAFPTSGDEYFASATTPEPLSFFIAQKAGLDVLRKQELLEMRSETQRLQTLKQFMEELLPDLREKRRISEVIMSDGYLPNSLPGFWGNTEEQGE